MRITHDEMSLDPIGTAKAVYEVRALRHLLGILFLCDAQFYQDNQFIMKMVGIFYSCWYSMVMKFLFKMKMF